MPEDSLAHKRLVRGIAKGAGIVFIATVVSRIFGYLIRAVIARHYGPEGYGFISTSLALFTITSTIALLGFSNSLTRQIAYYFNTDRIRGIKSLIFSAYGLSSTIAVIAGLFLFLNSRVIATTIFHDESLIPFLKYFAAGLVFFVWIKLSASIFKAFKKMGWYTLIQDVLRFAAIFSAVVIAILLHAPVQLLGLTYLVAFIVVGIFGTVAAYYLTPIRKFPAGNLFGETKKLFSFSWPLMLASIIHIFLYRIDILMIGYFMDQINVGIYNAAVPIGQLLTVIISSFTPLLLPVMTEYFAHDDITNLNNTFTLSTKWIFLLTIPVFSLMVFFPDFFLVVIFGKNFLEASTVLQIIAFGFLLSASVGPTGNLLVVVGKTHLNMINNLIAIVINIILNLLLIPQIGIYGAAVASAFSYAFLNILALIEIYMMYKIHPFEFVYIKITGLALVLGFGISFFYSPDRFFVGVILFAVYGLLYFLGLKLLRCFSQDDQIIFKEFEKRYTNFLRFIKRFLKIK